MTLAALTVPLALRPTENGSGSTLRSGSTWFSPCVSSLSAGLTRRASSPQGPWAPPAPAGGAAATPARDLPARDPADLRLLARRQLQTDHEPPPWRVAPRQRLGASLRAFP